MSTMPIALLGFAGRFPGAPNSQGLWDLLCAGRDPITPVPRSRWDSGAWVADEDLAAAFYGGFLSDIDRFDHQAFGISNLEARAMDPQQRLLLEVAVEALADAAFPPSLYRGRAVGVFVGCGHNEYGQLLAADPANIDAWGVAGMEISMVANRISHSLDLRGPSTVINAGCASALLAVHHAAQSLRDEDCDIALAGGVNLVLSPVPFLALSRSWVLSQSQRCRSFDMAADGYVRAEGLGLFVMKRLGDALRDHDPISGVLLGSATAHGGAGSGLTAPNSHAMENVVRKAQREAGITPDAIDYVEAHGVGTPASDAAEAQMLSRVFGARRGRAIAIGAIKSNIGHSEWASGAASLAKVLLALRHHLVPPNLHFQCAPEGSPLRERSFHVVRSPWSWPPTNGRDRIAGINSFGIGGTYVHLVIRELHLSEAPPTLDAQHTQDVCALSATTQNELRIFAQTLVGFLRSNPAVSLPDLCATLTLGRASLPQRAAFVATTREELERKLDQFIGGASVLAPGSSPASKLLARFLAGEDVDWAASWETGGRRIAGIPVPRGADTRHWYSVLPGQALGANLPHPCSPCEKEGRASHMETRRGLPHLQNCLRAKPADRWRLVVAFLQGEFQQMLGLEDPPSSFQGFFDMGVKSLMAVEMQSRLQRQLGGTRQWPATLLLECCNIHTLAKWLIQEAGLESHDADAGALGAVSSRPSHVESQDLVAVAALSEAEAEQALLQEIARGGPVE